MPAQCISVDWKKRFVTIFEEKQQGNKYNLSLTEMVKYCHELYPDTLSYGRLKILSLFLKYCRPEEECFERLASSVIIPWIKQMIKEGKMPKPLMKSYGPYFIRDKKAVYRYVKSNETNNWKVGYKHD